MPVPVLNHISIEHNDKFYIFGGDSGEYSHNRSYCTDFVQEYNPATNKWRLMENMPFKRSDMTGQKMGNFVFLLGGYPYNSRDYSSVLDEVWRFNLDSLKPFTYVTDVSLDKESLELKVGETWQLKAAVLPQDASDPSISWSSADPGVASVDQDGMVEGKAVGMTEIYVTTIDGQLQDTCQVTVTPDVGIDKTKTYQWLIFPNPTHDFLTIETQSPGQYFIEITSLNGQVIFTREMVRVTNQLDLSSFQKGVYFITIRSKDFVATRKMIKF
jgi:transglutaminase/protease-like cytokinesis protein 3